MIGIETLCPKGRRMAYSGLTLMVVSTLLALLGGSFLVGALLALIGGIYCCFWVIFNALQFLYRKTARLEAKLRKIDAVLVYKGIEDKTAWFIDEETADKITEDTVDEYRKRGAL